MKDTWYSVGVFGNGRLMHNECMAWRLQTAIKYAKAFKASHNIDCFVFDADESVNHCTIVFSTANEG